MFEATEGCHDRYEETRYVSIHGVCETQMGIKWNEAWLSHAFYNQWESLVYEFMHQLDILLRPMVLDNHSV